VKKSPKKSSDKTIYKCPHCDYSARAVGPLQRHINQKHPEYTKVKKVTIEKAVLTNLLKMAGTIVSKSGVDEQLPDSVIYALRENDIKLRVALRLIAIERVQRIIKLAGMLDKVDDKLCKKIEDDDKMDALSPAAVANLQTSLQNSIDSDVAFLKNAMGVGDEEGHKLSEEIFKVLGNVSLNHKGLSIHRTQSLHIDADPVYREEARALLNQIGLNVGDRPQST
jgi:uncharacterized C2H2 Zn-finger protein